MGGGGKFKLGGGETGFTQLRFQTVALVPEQWLITHSRKEEKRAVHFHWIPEKLNGRIILTLYLGRGHH